MGHVFIEKGFYIQGVNAASIAGYYDFDAAHFLAFQLYEDDGSPSKGSYKGPGYIEENRDLGVKYVVLGDPHRSTQLPAYKLSDTPEAESEKNLNDFVEGFKAAMEKKRIKKTANHHWREGFAEAKKVTGR